MSKAISFDSQVHELSGFSSDRATLKTAIAKTTSGEGTKLYDAIDLALTSLRKLEGRKAIVLFSDGVDWHSDQASDYSTLHWLEEEGVVVYPIRYNTRAEAERIARQGGGECGRELPTIDVIQQAKGGTQPTFPGDDDPREGPPVSATGDWTAWSAIGSRDYEKKARSAALATRLQHPTSAPHASRRTNRQDVAHGGDPITELMDRLYLVADKYLNDLADKSGGTVLRVDDLSTLPDAFDKVAVELQTQYVIGYYPTNKTHDGDYRNIDVTISRPQVIIRARPGYRARSGN